MSLEGNAIHSSFNWPLMHSVHTSHRGNPCDHTTLVNSWSKVYQQIHSWLNHYITGVGGYPIQYPDLARLPLSGEIRLRTDCTFYAGSDFYNLPKQPVDCLTDVEPTVCALLEPADQWLDFIVPWSVTLCGIVNEASNCVGRRHVHRSVAGPRACMHAVVGMLMRKWLAIDHANNCA